MMINLKLALLFVTSFSLASFSEEPIKPSAQSNLSTEGIASKYPGDAGIARDPKVIFVEDFEEKSLDELWQKWESVVDKPGQSFTVDVPSGSSGKQSLLMDRMDGPGAHLYRRLKMRMTDGDSTGFSLVTT